MIEDANAPISAHELRGLTDDELERITEILGRNPNDLELALYGVMWSEHCSYKSSRIHLGRLPTKAPQVLVGPGENAGVIDIGDGMAIALRMESHNHPSFIEPFQGAATGVGGILRDIFTMGVRPVALMDPLFVGPLSDPHARYILDGVVRGVAGYGNSVGVPTIGGQIVFHPTYRANPLVNVFCLGVLPVERLVLGSAHGPGNLAVLLGARTGRDGIGGVSVLASAGFSDASPEQSAKRPSVQIGDPYEEKRLIEACVEILSRNLAVGIQDLGGAGLACATSETAARGGVGMEVDVESVPTREPDMSPIDVMTSESQERMLAIVAPESIEELREVCARWEINATVVGRVTEAGSDGIGRLRIYSGTTGASLADVPAASLAEDGPRYERPLSPPPDLEARLGEDPGRLSPPADCGADLLSLMIDPAWIYRQYDHQLFLNTVFGPGEADAAVLFVGPPERARTGKAIALSSDANPNWCAFEPRRGTAATVFECYLNVSCAGARPLGLVNCLNFGNPEHESVMWAFSEAVDGLAEACRVLDVPVVGGNVSLYNESDGRDILPTPVVAIVGLIEQLERRPPHIAWHEGDTVVLLGERSQALAGSRWANELYNTPGGSLEAIDVPAFTRLAAFVRAQVATASRSDKGALVRGIHDVSDGGIGVALGEFALRSGIGCHVVGLASHAELFSESPTRVIVATAEPEALLDAARSAGVAAAVIGEAGGERVVIDGLVDLPLHAIAETATRLSQALDLVENA